ncbi:MAG: DUF3108 domain-containing protein [Deltaproteobacteria bacterium]|jgi:hypothetical protein|nr:DUF3108 domain-containing protein [Deltaproteobacteria bacterium]MCL5880558.1 DUF3108 domain-containing protein [Deltaproteobacteria bacterium]MDA8304018.1 DUF3108 domain-containing protein [Deltaproteobacteria bacterium]
MGHKIKKNYRFTGSIPLIFFFIAVLTSLIPCGNLPSSAARLPGWGHNKHNKKDKALAILIKKAYGQREKLRKNLAANVNGYEFPPLGTLTYEITYMDWIKAGTAVLSAKPGYFHDKRVIILKAKANSASWMNFLYFVNDYTTSYFSKAHLYPYFLSMVRHEGWRNDYMEEWLNIGGHNSLNDSLIPADNVQTVFAALNNKKFTAALYKFKTYSSVALMKDKINSPFKAFVSYKDSQDSLSSLYYLRMFDLKEGRDYYIPVFNHRKRYIVLIKAMGYYIVNTPAGKFNCIKLKVYLNFNGVFVHKGALDIYVTRGDGHIPVYLVARVSIGFASAILIKKNLTP